MRTTLTAKHVGASTTATSVGHPLTERRARRVGQTRWRINHRYEGGFITDGGVHYVAAVRLLFGDILQGYAQTHSVNSKIGRTDQLRFQFITDRQIYGQLNFNFSSNGFNENRLLIFGDQGTLIVTNDDIVLQKAGESPEPYSSPDDDGGLTGEYEDFYQAITQRKPPVSSFEEGFADLQVILGALQSAREGKVRDFRDAYLVG